MHSIEEQRQFMKSNAQEWNNIKSDQMKKLPCPPLEKPYDENSEIIELPKVNKNVISKANILDIITDRKSRRKYTTDSLTIDELSFLLWTTQGIKKVSSDGRLGLRTVPSAGGRHAFETYIAVNRVEGLKKGVYRYLPVEHKLVFLFDCEDYEKKLPELALNQTFIGKGVVTFIWSCIPYRGEWRYDIIAHKHMLIDAGHICQNLYLACEAIGCGTCGIGAYDQKAMDEFLKIDGKDEFVVYMAPVGKVED